MFFASPIPGTRPEAVRDAYEPFEEFVLAQPETERMFSVSGGFNGGGIVLKDEYADAAGLSDFYTRLFMPASTIPGWQFFVPVRSSLFDDTHKAQSSRGGKAAGAGEGEGAGVQKWLLNYILKKNRTVLSVLNCSTKECRLC